MAADDDYDIAKPMAPEEWLAIDEDERMRLIQQAHERARSPMGQSPTAHAAMHAVVENRLAMGDRAVADAYDRCRAAGLDRHTAVHALASVVTRHMMAILETHEGFDQETADRDYAALDPEAWKPKNKKPKPPER